jgi:hypothetical protein
MSLVQPITQRPHLATCCCHALQGCTDEAVCAYFNAVTSGLAERQLQHYHFKICNGRFDTRTQSQSPKWHCTVLHSAQDTAADASAVHKGPLQVRGAFQGMRGRDGTCFEQGGGHIWYSGCSSSSSQCAGVARVTDGQDCCD